MGRFIVRRVLLAIPVLIGLLVITFVLIRIIPTDPAVVIAGESATPAQVQAIREQYGLDRPIVEQFLRYVWQVARLDFGVSLFSRLPITEEIARRLPATLELTTAALLLGVALGVPLGVVAAIHHNRTADIVLRIISVMGVAVASFWLAIMLQLLFAMDLGWLPLRGRFGDQVPGPVSLTGFLTIDSLLTGRLDAFIEALRYLALPAITLSLSVLATIIRFTRAGVLDTLQKDFVEYERAVGYPTRRLIWVYVLRNSVVSAITQIGLLFGGLIAGAVVVESIFDWPGVGSYTVNAILTSDSNVMMAVTLVVGLVYVSVNIIVDVVHGLIDPRLREVR